MSGVTLPGPTVGVVGGGQLGRMLAEAASPLGVELVVLDPTPDCPASLVARDQIEAPFDDETAIERLASRVDVLTYEIELADQSALERVSESTGVPVHPHPETLARIHDKLVQKRAFASAGIPVPDFRQVDDATDLEAALAALGSPLMLKARTGGYDGRGNMPVSTDDDLEGALDAIGGPAMAEAFVDFERELAVIAARGADERTTFPVTETIHEREILRETVAPARTDDTTRERARSVALEVLEHLSGRGVFGIELFETGDGEILVNEVAPRPHNSGHWTIEGTRTSQFEQHVRAVVGWPLGPTDLEAPTATANLLGDVEASGPARLSGVSTVLEDPRAHLHWYGKREVRPLRKMGHVTVPGREQDAVLERVRTLRSECTFKP